MLMRTDPFRDVDRLAQQVLGTAARPAVMPMDAWREGDTFVVELTFPASTPTRWISTSNATCSPCTPNAPLSTASAKWLRRNAHEVSSVGSCFLAKRSTPNGSRPTTAAVFSG